MDAPSRSPPPTQQPFNRAFVVFYVFSDSRGKGKGPGEGQGEKGRKGKGKKEDYDLGGAVNLRLTNLITVDGNVVEMEIPQVVTISGILNSGISISEYHSGIAKHENLNQIEWITDRGTLRLNAMTSLEWSESGKDFEPVQVPENQTRDWMVEADFTQAVRLEHRLDFLDSFWGLREAGICAALVQSESFVEVASHTLTICVADSEVEVGFWLSLIGLLLPT